MFMLNLQKKKEKGGEREEEEERYDSISSLHYLSDSLFLNLHSLLAPLPWHKCAFSIHTASPEPIQDPHRLVLLFFGFDCVGNCTPIVSPCTIICWWSQI
jgi:hypothetical protein